MNKEFSFPRTFSAVPSFFHYGTKGSNIILKIGLGKYDLKKISSKNINKKQKTKKENIYFVGRLAEYKYYDMDDVIYKKSINIVE